jgi:hypothetical protein
MRLLSRAQVQQGTASAFADVDGLRARLQDAAPPAAVTAWLGRLKLLYGVPIQYLVPNEGMLPPESIRFFHLDMNWVDALVDGAFSIGRTLSAAAPTASMNVDEAVAPQVSTAADAVSATIRARALGVPAPVVSFQTVTGFLLRSSVVAAYPGLGVNAYPAGGTPEDTDIVLLDILRLERLGPQSDTLICLVAGEPVRVDVHEAPEALHYGIDQFDAQTALKKIHLFTQSGNTVTMSDALAERDLRAGGALRATAPRTVKMTALAQLIGTAQHPSIPTVDAAQMGFEMTEGVGMVSFNRTGGA